MNVIIECTTSKDIFSKFFVGLSPIIILSLLRNCNDLFLIVLHDLESSVDDYLVCLVLLFYLFILGFAPREDLHGFCDRVLIANPLT